jgi:glucose/arabinose dehydrogenase
MVRRIGAGLAIAAVVMTTLPGQTLAGGLGVTQVAIGFDAPVFLTHAGDSRLFVVEQSGRIKVMTSAGASLGTFLNLSTIVKYGGERGLLGLAFHPDYDSNGLFYVDYVRKGDGASVIAEFKVSSGNANIADAASGRIVMTISQPYTNHKGGWIGFRGPYLYIAKGDGGSGGDPGNRAQNKDKLLGKILRINPLDPDAGGPLKYSIPADNPFVGRAGRDEVWWYGLRNPWRCSFDGGDLWCGDVGQEKWEEVSRSSAGGLNMGWRLLEGKHYYNWSGHTKGALCTTSCKTKPIIEYSHASFGGGNCAVTGGYVARRPGATLEGQYILGDYCSGNVWAVPANFGGGALAESNRLANTSYLISSFGKDDSGRIYLVDRGGAIYRLNGT